MSRSVDAVPPARLPRGVAFGTVSVSLATGAHVLGGGAIPSVGTVSVLTVVAAVLGAAVGGRRLSRLGVMLLVVSGQVLLHVAFMVGAVADRSTIGAGAHAGMPGMAHGAAHTTAGGTMLSHHLEQSVTTLPGLAMTAAHTGAAALVALWLAAGEDLARRLVRLLAAPVAAAVLRAGGLLLARVRAGGHLVALWSSALLRQRGSRWSPRSWPVLLRVERRGPPDGLLASA